MTQFEWTVTILTVFSVLLLPVLALMFRGAVKWTRTEDKLSELVGDMREMITDKDRVHAEMLSMMKSDRDAADRRLRFLEEFWMEKGRQAYRP